MATNARDPKAGILTGEKITRAAFYRGQGLDWKDVARRVDVKNVNGLMAAVKADGIPDNGVPPGSFEVRCVLSAPRYHDLKAQLQQAGYGLEDGLAEFVGQAAKDRVVGKALARGRT